ncbi:MAG: hypothetical protein WBB28_13265 [Crinalium sp.]
MNSATATFIEKPYILVTESDSLNGAKAPILDILPLQVEVTG